MKQRINNVLIIERMSALGLSERQTMGSLDFPIHAFREARLTGWLQGHINIRQASRLADTLGVTLSELFAVDAPMAEPAAPVAATTAEDAATLVPLLLSLTGLVDTGRLAIALEWDRSRLLAAVDGIPVALDGTGMRLVRTGANIAVEPINQPSVELRRRVGNSPTAHKALNLTQARILRRIVDGEHVAEKATANADRVALGALKNKGCIEIGDLARWRITADLALALGHDLDV